MGQSGWNDSHFAAAERMRQSRIAADKAFLALPPEWRAEFVRDAFFRLPIDEQRKLVTLLVVTVPPPGADEAPEPEPQEAKALPAEPKAAPQKPPKLTGSYVDKAEAYVLAHPEGVETAQVGKAIGQKTMNADGSLRQVMNTRKTIERRDRKWFPLASDDYAPEPGKQTIRTIIVNVFTAMKKPLDSTDIWEGAKRLVPTINRGSFENEMNRLRRDRLITALEGKQGKHGSGVYVLANGGTHATP
jgi:hypothetical protein